MKPITITTMLLVFLAIGCKKYEEGPSFSFRSAKSRIEGKWKVTSRLVNNKESFNVWEYDEYRVMRCKATGKDIDIGGPGIERHATTETTFEFQKGGEMIYFTNTRYEDIDFDETEKQCTGIWKHVNTPTIELKTKWELDKKKENIIEDRNSYKYNWEIIMLKEKKMKIKMTSNNITEEYTMEKI